MKFSQVDIVKNKNFTVQTHILCQPCCGHHCSRSSDSFHHHVFTEQQPGNATAWLTHM